MLPQLALHSELLSCTYELNPPDDISRYSYVNDGFAYLEEDLDAGLFIRAMQVRGYHVETDSVFEEKTQIRSFARFLPKAAG